MWYSAVFGIQDGPLPVCTVGAPFAFNRTVANDGRAAVSYVSYASSRSYPMVECAQRSRAGPRLPSQSVLSTRLGKLSLSPHPSSQALTPALSPSPGRPSLLVRDAWRLFRYSPPP